MKINRLKSCFHKTSAVKDIHRYQRLGHFYLVIISFNGILLDKIFLVKSNFQ